MISQGAPTASNAGDAAVVNVRGFSQRCVRLDDKIDELRMERPIVAKS